NPQCKKDTIPVTAKVGFNDVHPIRNYIGSCFNNYPNRLRTVSSDSTHQYIGLSRNDFTIVTSLRFLQTPERALPMNRLHHVCSIEGGFDRTPLHLCNAPQWAPI